MSLEKAVVWLARMLAVLGGIVLVVITTLTVLSISGRAIITIAHTGTDNGISLLEWIREGARWLISLQIEIGKWTFRVGNVPGDFELVEAGVGFAVFSFLPWCQLNRGHATVDLFTSFLPESANRVIDVVTELLMTIIITLIAWRLWQGMLDKQRYGETTFILQYPIWWAYAACLVAAVIAVIVTVYVLIATLRAALAGRRLAGMGQGEGY